MTYPLITPEGAEGMVGDPTEIKDGEGIDPKETGDQGAEGAVADPGDGDGDGSGDPASPPEPKKKTAQERIDEITRARREAEREAAYWRKVALDKAQAQEPEKPQGKTTEIPNVPPRPSIEQFESTQEYEDALFAWYDQRREIVTEMQRRQQAQEKAVEAFSKRAKELRAEHEDFDEVIEAPVFSPVMRTAILHSENGPAIAYHLGRPENREVADRIRALPPEVQAYEIGRLETKLVLAKNTRKPTGAPPPIKPVGMSGGAPAKDPSEMSIDEWMKWDRERQAEKLKRKYAQ